MPKMKTHRGAAKRCKRTGSGKLSRHHAYTSHLAPRKTTKQKRHLKKGTLVSSSDYKRVKNLLVYKD
ncbi:50S ribosomal protein L35 [Mycoplasmatota bacterium]|nr:50S ribosomal protein L35 [Mycoplasmatota bacterium]